MRTVVIAARRNPESNPKVCAYDYLKKWSKNPDVYISFTEIDKIGVNPQSKFNTPLGIYTYPLAVAWRLYHLDDYRSLRSLPFAADAPYVWAVRVRDKTTFVNDLYKDYGSDKFDRDVETLKSLFFAAKAANTENSVKKYGSSGNSDLQKLCVDTLAQAEQEEWESLYNKSLGTARVKNSVTSFWNLSRLLALNLTSGKRMQQTIMCKAAASKWNWLLRQCGYSGFADKSGKGIIHPSEPMQAIFLSRSAFKVIGQVDNRDYLSRDNRLDVPSINILCTRILPSMEEGHSEELTQWLLGEAPLSTGLKRNYKFPFLAEEMWKEASPSDLKRLNEAIVRHAQYCSERSFSRMLPRFKQKCFSYMPTKIQ